MLKDHKGTQQLGLSSPLREPACLQEEVTDVSAGGGHGTWSGLYSKSHQKLPPRLIKPDDSGKGKSKSIYQSFKQRERRGDINTYEPLLGHFMRTKCAVQDEDTGYAASLLHDPAQSCCRRASPSVLTAARQEKCTIKSRGGRSPSQRREA